MTRDDVEAFIDREFPQIHHGGRIYRIEEVGPLSSRVRMNFHERHVRPGGTLSGPSMMALADYALYVAILAQIGPVGLAVTTNLSFNFLRRPARRAPCRSAPAQARQAARGRRSLVLQRGLDGPRVPRHRDLLHPDRPRAGGGDGRTLIP